MTINRKKEWLGRYAILCDLCSACQKEISDIARPSASRLSASPKGKSNVSTVELSAEKRLEVNNELKLYEQEKEKIRQEIAEAIHRLDAKEELFLRLRYLNLMDWYDLCEYMRISNSTAYRIQAKALTHLIIPCESK